MPIFTAAGVPFIAPFTGAEALRSPVNRYIFNVRASYFDETERLVEFVSGFGMTRIAVFYQDDTYGKAGLDGVQRAMLKRNLKISGTGTVERNTVNVAGAVKAIAALDPQAVIMVSAYKPCAAFIKAMNAAGSHPQFLNVSFVGSKALSHELAEAGRGVGISQVVPFPWNIGSTLVRDYQRMLKQQTGKEEYSFTSLEGFIAARVLVEGLRRAGKELTRDKLINALETMGELDLGGFGVRYSANDHHGSRFVDLTVIGRQDTFLR
jgi:ABC-type branched-subunit amino acid transport system substrate-binding protein